jgi:secreted trypsin-like serine protease
VQTFRGKSYSDTICDSTVRVVGGSKLRPGDAPWQALLWRPKEIPAVGRPFYIDERVLCGGSVIRTGWILTAAHCVRDYGASVAGRGYSIRLGVYNPRNENEGTSYPITRVYTHPSYDPSDYAFDIALIRYDATKGVRGPTSYPITRIAFDTVPVETRRITNATSAFIYGWGWTQADRGRTTAELRGAKLQLSTLEACTAITKFRGRKLNAALCAAGRNNEQACQGDSGGPLVYYNDADKRPRVIGVISAGRKCGQNRTREASRYTRVALVRQWIERTMAGGR